MLSAVYAVIVCLSVCLCVCHAPVLYQNGLSLSFVVKNEKVQGYRQLCLLQKW